ncbi:Aste57867_18950 [Aphanomyces stellatus]|uniref:Aste57867_18950 protein n=1 Tax=Aphanomyces stellatus TaxID=120398 RepID=A0A485LBM7_9STRA|nr:hypothetical protein As57867_018886 [Aphanomyces stellatus]VFT95680.1 Aste57867_18950 [Aphanomyces stellatus]
MFKCVGLRSPRPLGGNQDSFLHYGPSGPKSKRWEKEFAVTFDDHKPMGLGFVQVKGDGAATVEYAASVQRVLSSKERDNLAFDHNEHCYLSCDLSRLLTPGLRIRAINEADTQGMPFDAVLAKIKTTKRPIMLTFADVGSEPIAPPKSKRQSSIKSTSCSSLASDSDNPAAPPKTMASLAADVVRLREQLREAQLAKSEAEAQVEQFKKWNATLLTTHDAVSDQQIAILDQVRNDQTTLEAARTHVAALLAERDAAVAEWEKERRAVYVQRQSEREATAQQLHALAMENQSLHTRVERLHERLEETQLAKRHADTQVAALEKKRAEELRLLETLRREILTEDEEASELDKLLQAEAAKAVPTDDNLKEKHEATMAKLRQQRAAHATHKASLQSALEEHMAKAHADKERMGELVAELEARELAHATATWTTAQAAERSQAAVEGTHDALAQAHAHAAAHARVCAELDDTHSKFAHAKTEWRLEKTAWEAEKVAMAARLAESQERAEMLTAQLAQTQAAKATEEHLTEEAANADAAVLGEFIHRMSTKGFRVHKHGRRGSTHDRFLYTDTAGHWMSWVSVDEAKRPDAFRHPQKKISVDFQDLVDILPGKQTEVFARANSHATPADRCFSLVCAKPCRTIDIETDTAEQCQRLIQGFRLLRASRMRATAPHLDG